MIRIKKSWLYAAIMVVLAGCAAAVTAPELECDCGNVSLTCTFGDATYRIPEARCSREVGGPVETCINSQEHGIVCTTETTLLGRDAIMQELTPTPAEGEEAPPPAPTPEPALTCTFTPQNPPADYEGDPAELYCWECTSREAGCSEAYRQTFNSIAPSQ